MSLLEASGFVYHIPSNESLHNHNNINIYKPLVDAHYKVMYMILSLDKLER